MFDITFSVESASMPEHMLTDDAAKKMADDIEEFCRERGIFPKIINVSITEPIVKTGDQITLQSMDLVIDDEEDPQL